MAGRQKLLRGRRSPKSPTVPNSAGPHPNELRLIKEIHPDAMLAVEEAVFNLFKSKLGDSHKIKAMNVIDEFIINKISSQENWREWDRPTWLKWKTLLNVVRDIAISDPRYHGITDIVNERKCAGCRIVKHVDEFPGERLRCNKCGEWNADL